MIDRFDEVAYLFTNPDVAAAVERGQFSSGREHFELFGAKENRRWVLPSSMTRRDKALSALKADGRGMEIGPSHSPLAPKREGFKVDILDHASQDQLKEKYRRHGVDLDRIEPVDFVWSGQRFSELTGRTSYYDWIIASHVIEHVPDFVSFLQQCSEILRPEGILSLIIPDKRYCFDHFCPQSTTGHMLDAWAEKRVKPSTGQIFDHIANAATRFGKLAWGSDGNGGGTDLVHTVAQARDNWVRSRTTDDYIDVHCWRFTPSSFRLIVSDLRALSLIDFEIKVEFETTGCQFHVSLSKGTEDEVQPDRIAALKNQQSEAV